MKNSRQTIYAGLAICIYATWSARDLLSAWLHSPFDKMGFPALILWLVPLGMIRMARQVFAQTPLKITPAFFGASLVFAFAGNALDLNIVKYIGLAFACAGFLPFRAVTVAWLLLAVVWMPVFGWLLKNIGPVPVNALRVVLAALSCGFTTLNILHNEPNR
jgi:hypothetical protein